MFFKFNKNCCIVFGITSNLDFAVGNCIYFLEKYSSKYITNYIIYIEENLPDSSKKALKTISNNKVIFKIFDDLDEHLLEEKKLGNIVSRYSKMYFCKFKIFDELRFYDRVLWLDADILVQDTIKNLLSYKGICWRPAVVSLSHKISLPNFYIDDKATSPNAGVILITKELRNYNISFSDCISIFCWIKDYTNRPSIDELTFGILSLKNKLPLQLLPAKYNSGCGWPNTEKAVIVHSIGPRKFWNYSPYNIIFSKWKEGFEEWEKLVPTVIQKEMQFEKIWGNSQKTLLSSISFSSYWMEKLNNLYLPNGISLNTNFTRKYVQFYINNLPKKIHYELLLEGDKKLDICLHIESSRYITEKVLQGLENISNLYGYKFDKKENFIGMYKSIHPNSANVVKELHDFICKSILEISDFVGVS